MAFIFSKCSLQNLEGVHPWLIELAHRALELTAVDFAVIEGLRTRDRQAELVRVGASAIMDSYHLTGHAIDVVAYVGDSVRWDWPLYDRIAMAFKAANEAVAMEWNPIDSLEKGLTEPKFLTWGGDWETLKDGHHFQINR